MDSTTSKTAHDIHWETNYHLLEKFIAEFGRFPKRNEIYRETKLGEWCSNQKRRIKQSGCTERIEKLSAIGLFNEDAGFLNYQWEQNYQLLQTFIEEQQRFPQVTETYQDCNLGAWYATQKRLLQSEDYPAERRAKIEAFGIKKATVKEDWEQHYQDLQDFINEYHRLPKQQEEYRGFKLGLWCMHQVQQAKNKHYSKERRKKLEYIGLLQCENTHNAKHLCPSDEIMSYRDTLWEEHYQQLCAFVENHHRLPKTVEKYDDFSLGQWYATQKSKMKKSDYPSKRREKLAAIGLLNSNNDNS